MTLHPEASTQAAPPVLRVHLQVPSRAEVDVERALLFEGELGPAHLRQITRGQLSKALSKRIVPALVWMEEPTTDEPVSEGRLLVLAPTVELQPGGTYTFASALPEAVQVIHVTPTTMPTLSRLWPPAGQASTASFGVWCGLSPLPELEVAVHLDPEGPPGNLLRGAAAGLGESCVRFQPAAGHEDAGDGPFLGPPDLLLDEGLQLALSPRPFTMDTAPSPYTATECDGELVPFGPGCALVEDDRVLVQSPDAPLFWAVAGEGHDLVAPRRPGEPLILAPLQPDASIHFDIVVLDTAGRAERSHFRGTTLAPMAHVVITEVLANPIGAEPSQEWVELYNDGLVAADLGGYVLEDVGGRTVLPEASLPPGTFALVVNASFQEDDGLDPPPAPGTILLRVPKLGKNGLSNGGEPLRLSNASGRVVSRTPALAPPRAGMSLARTAARAPDGLADSFTTDWPSPGRGHIMKKAIP
ncbi:lamin tail domain-containing protein [Chondromyces crocatus]|uniref:lamin tail domain-containing protein n=1 Tax=Chondromyces crocatus TaxID=52 RepID=UPI0014705BDA|nr:lamin tail domain-containing protein [Chondromyces crocatus]